MGVGDGDGEGDGTPLFCKENFMQSNRDFGPFVNGIVICD